MVHFPAIFLTAYIYIYRSRIYILYVLRQTFCILVDKKETKTKLRLIKNL
jgi:hypothetical protein